MNKPIKPIRPMLATEPGKIRFPVYASYKIDGVRILVNSGAKTRSMKPLPNKHVAEFFERNPYLNGLDGEAVVGSPVDPLVLNNTTSGLMSHAGEPDFTFYVFDYWTSPDTPYCERYARLEKAFSDESFIQKFPHLKLLEQRLICDKDSLDLFEQHAIEAGYEGIMIRDPEGIYKYGRSTAKEGYLLKVKTFVDGEAVIIGAVEMFRNMNDPVINELGLTERSSSAEGKVPANMLGALIVRDLKTNIEFELGSGYTHEQRTAFWSEYLTGTLIGKVAKYKSFPIGVKDKPRLPVFLGIRPREDMDFCVGAIHVGEVTSSVTPPAYLQELPKAIPPVTSNTTNAELVSHIRHYCDDPVVMELARRFEEAYETVEDNHNYPLGKDSDGLVPEDLDSDE